MATSNKLYLAASTLNDARVRIFRRVISLPGELNILQVDAYAIITRRYLVLCDTLLCPEDAAFMMHELKNDLPGRQILVVNSHADWDHCWGNHYFSDKPIVPIIAHQQNMARWQADDVQATLTNYKQRFPIFHNVELHQPTLTFTDALTIAGGDLTLEMFHTPGHSADHIALWIPEIQLLLGFDAIEDPFPTIENAHSVSSLQATLSRFQHLQPRHVFYSHGEINDPEVIVRNKAYIQELEQRCHTLLATGNIANTEHEAASRLLHYPLEEAIPTGMILGDQQFYREVHEHNIRCVLRSLMR